MKYAIEDTTLMAIGDAIRSKGETTELIKVSDLADAIINLPSGGGGGIEVEPIVLTGDQERGCAGVMVSNYIKIFGDTVSTSDITRCSNMFDKYSHTIIPFDIYCKSGTNCSVSYLFHFSKITKAPRVFNCKPAGTNVIFGYAYYLREIPDDFCDTWDWSYMNSSGSMAYNAFTKCYSLRKVPSNFIKNNYAKASSNYQCYQDTFSYCYVLDEIKDLVVIPHELTSNKFAYTFQSCYRLKNMTFDTNEDGTPKTAYWGKQIINLSSYVGYTSRSDKSNILNYNSGITADKEVKDDATYQALKNDPDWFALTSNYSRYNRTSAVNTINSLPDTSAYGTNTIKFEGAAGALTDGGAINTMTEEEIAVATAKGWTVSFV